MAQVTEHLPSKWEDQSSNPSIEKKRKKKEQKGKSGIEHIYRISISSLRKTKYLCF
jgi:hypothetical protein